MRTLCILLFLCAFTWSAYAQPSRRLAETVVGERVSVERTDGVMLHGIVRSVDDSAVFLMADDGGLQEVVLDDIVIIRLVTASTQAPSVPQAPQSAPAATETPTSTTPGAASEAATNEDAAPAARPEDAPNRSASQGSISASTTIAPVQGHRRDGALGGAAWESEIIDAERQSTVVMSSVGAVDYDRSNPDFIRGRRISSYGGAILGTGLVAMTIGTVLLFTAQSDCGYDVDSTGCVNNTAAYSLIGAGSALTLVGSGVSVAGVIKKQRALRFNVDTSIDVTPMIRRDGFGGTLRVRF